MIQLLKPLCCVKNKIFNSAWILALFFAMGCGGADSPNADDEQQQKAADLAVVQTLSKQLAAQPDSLGIRYQLMNALARVQDYKAALRQNDTLLLNDSANAPVLFRRGVILLQSGDTAAAESALNNATVVAPMFAEPRLQLAALYAGKSDARALSITDTLIRHAMETNVTSQARFIKGLYYSNINNKEKAIAQFDECIKNDYTFLEAYVEKGLLLYDLKNYAEALAVFEKSIVVSNTFAEGYYQAGRCEQALGNKEQARTYYQKTLGLDKNFTGVEEALKSLN